MPAEHVSNDVASGLARFRRRRRLQRREVVDDRLLVVVFCPAERSGVVRAILDSRVGAELDEQLDQFEVAVEGGLVQGGQPLDIVDVEAQFGQQSYGVEAAELGGAHDQVRSARCCLGAERGGGGQLLLDGGPVCSHAGGEEGIDRVECGVGAGGGECVGDLAAAAEGGELVGGEPV